jgi:hypothetical protein
MAKIKRNTSCLIANEAMVWLEVAKQEIHNAWRGSV